MASFVIHHIAGIRLLEILSDYYDINLTEVQKNQFLLGNLIVDSVKTKATIPSNLGDDEVKEMRRKFALMIQKEKNATHFRYESEQGLVIQVPNLNDFVDKYSRLIIDDFTVLGYFFHLYTDKMFFGDLFMDTFECLDREQNVTIYLKDVENVRIKKNNILCSINDFFDHKYSGSIYNDYTKINKILLDYYNIVFDQNKFLDAVRYFINPGVEEVDYSNIIEIINKTNTFISDSYKCNDSNLNVFDEEIIKKFIDNISKSFFENYDYLINKSKCKSLKKINK